MCRGRGLVWGRRLRDLITERAASGVGDLPTGNEGKYEADRPYPIARSHLTLVRRVPEMAGRFLRSNP